MKKANFHFYKHVLAAVLLLLGAQSMQAQEAFYIYRNDGDFNGFFFDFGDCVSDTIFWHSV